MKILHTSDWHIGRMLYGRKRYSEYEEFLVWLADLIRSERVDALLVSGDIFDNSAPSNRAQELYYRFLYRIAGSSCRHVVIIAGNHDSPSFIDAPKQLLGSLNVHVVGAITESLADEVLVLKDRSGVEELIVCAIPYLRDRDIRTAEAGETLEDKDRKLIEGISSHYLEVCELARLQKAAMDHPVPIIAMGHLFTTGAQTVEGDGVGKLYIGSLSHVDTDVFPEYINYVALGHLHVPQIIGHSDIVRYSGSPLPMGFGEANHDKSICLIEMSDSMSVVTRITVPRFQTLERICGNWDQIASRLGELKFAGSNAWIEIFYEGEEVAGNLSEHIDGAVAGTKMEILRVKNNRVMERALSRAHEDEELVDLDANDVFLRCLDQHAVPEDQRSELLSAYQEIVTSLHEEDALAE
jgi:exonuclease SbcD